jgi:hypothetical protein
MSTFQTRLEDIAALIVYKNWRFQFAQDGFALWNLQVRFAAPHSESGADENWTGRKWRITPHMSDSEIVQTALKAVLAAEEHEARERFMYRGRAVYGPHLDVEQLWHLAGKTDALDVRQPIRGTQP